MGARRELPDRGPVNDRRASHESGRPHPPYPEDPGPPEGPKMCVGWKDLHDRLGVSQVNVGNPSRSPGDLWSVCRSSPSTPLQRDDGLTPRCRPSGRGSRERTTWSGGPPFQGRSGPQRRTRNPAARTTTPGPPTKPQASQSRGSQSPPARQEVRGAARPEPVP